MSTTFYETIAPVADFDRVLDPDAYHAVPDDWWVGVTDVVESSAAIAAGRYKAVNLAGAAAISAVINALGHQAFPFAFAGDGAQFALPGGDAAAARDALARTAAWVRADLHLDLRVALIPIGDIRKAGVDVKVARYSASPALDYAMFSGGGIRWAETELKAGRISLAPAAPDARPDLSGLSCQWGPVRSRNGAILSIIVRPNEPVPGSAYSDATGHLLQILHKEEQFNPMPARGPDLGWPKGSAELMGRLVRSTAPQAARRLRAVLQTLVLSLLFRLRLKLGSFDSVHYRRMVSANTDFQKYGDGLYLTVDCGDAVAQEIEELLKAAQAKGILSYGLHRQKEAMMTCVVPSISADTHLHFLDGSGGGYASAAASIKAAG
ncbi:MAG: DUF3095 domain-containing protein [Proteobacteria bacterium]|nr:DUF3095 domain-containing protein [Pseudomonadota bacterium]MDA1057983.1 DUF3095 domain-containing protein [Pseudomonadota bacterium]